MEPDGVAGKDGECPAPQPVQQYNISDPAGPKSFVFNALSAAEVLQTTAYVVRPYACSAPELCLWIFNVD